VKYAWGWKGSWSNNITPSLSFACARSVWLMKLRNSSFLAYIVAGKQYCFSVPARAQHTSWKRISPFLLCLVEYRTEESKHIPDILAATKRERKVRFCWQESRGCLAQQGKGGKAPSFSSFFSFRAVCGRVRVELTRLRCLTPAAATVPQRHANPIVHVATILRILTAWRYRDTFTLTALMRRYLFV